MKLTNTLTVLAATAALSFPVLAPAQSVDCSTAKADIAHLEHEKKSTDERKVKGVMSIMPIGLAINVLSSASSSGSDKEMHVDEYNKKLDKRIAEIKAACKL